MSQAHRWVGVVALGLALWALDLQWDRSRSRLTASRVLLQVEVQMASELERGGVSAQRVRANIDLLRRVNDDALDPADFAIPLAIGSHYLLLENAEAAIRWYEQALELETRPEILLNLARAHRLAGRPVEADRYLSLASALDPLHYAQFTPSLDRRFEEPES